jgi:hypothetical protein
MTNRRGAVLHKSSLAINDISGSYHISSLNKGGYGNRNNTRSISNRNRRYGVYPQNRNGTRRQITLSMRVD